MDSHAWSWCGFCILQRTMFRVTHAALLVLAMSCATGEPGAPDGSVDPRPDSSVLAADATATPDASEQASEPDAGGSNSSCAVAMGALSFGWEVGDQGWAHGPMEIVDPPPVSWTFDSWERGNASSGPGSCASGASCWGTNLSGNYVSCQRAFLRSSSLDLSDCTNATVQLTFNHAYDFWTGNEEGQTWFDGGLVEISGDGGATWQPALISYPGTIQINPYIFIYECVHSGEFYVHNQPGFVGTSSGWEQVSVAIPNALKTAAFQVRFAYASGVSSATDDQSIAMSYTRPGWYIDDLRFVAQ